MMNEIIKKVNERSPLIHCITNPISINGCANVILAVGARPIMAEHPLEVAEITNRSDGLMLNLGNITDARIKSMQISGKTAKEKGIPILIDAVGVACSALRRKLALRLIETCKPTVIKGNCSEIMALMNPDYSAAGVDSEKLGDISGVAVKLAKRSGGVVLVSGKRDIITDGQRIAYVKNGCAQLGKITGTGCMLGALCTAYLAISDGYEAAKTACAVMGICGERSRTAKGNGSFGVNLLDNLSSLTDAEKYVDLEEKI